MRHGIVACLGFAKEVAVRALNQLAVFPDSPLKGPSRRFRRYDHKAEGMCRRLAHMRNKVVGMQPVPLSVVTKSKVTTE